MSEAIGEPTISAERIAQDIETIAGFSETDAGIGHSRPTFSAEWARARDYVVSQAEQAGCSVRIDTAGNVHARPSKLDWNARAWLCGSHLDSVPTGGKYDGVMGVVIPLEILRSYPTAALELIIFAEEEGTTFGLGMLGSKAWVGDLSAEKLGSLRNRAGQDYFAAGESCGTDSARIGDEENRLHPQNYFGMIEVHAEQGASLWNRSIPAAVVTGINGRNQYSCSVQGMENHAGSTQMGDRLDALAAAAEMIGRLEKLGVHLHNERHGTVITVGEIQARPNAVNVIPGRVDFSIDFRAPDDSILERGDEEIRTGLSEICARRGLKLEIEREEQLPAMPLDASVCSLLREASRQEELSLPEVTSGALHDTAIIARYLPAAMLFVASKDGISHNPNEFSRTEDIAAAARIVARAVTMPADKLS